RRYSLQFVVPFLFFVTSTATTEIYTLSLHDALPIYRTTNGSGKVRDFTMKELKEFDASNEFQQYGKQEIPTFRELCELLKPLPDILLNVEIKPSADAKEAADEAIVMLKEYDYLTRCVFTSFDAEVIAHI